MAERGRNFDTEFWGIIEYQASQDPLLRGVTEYLITGKTELIHPELLHELDGRDIEEYIVKNYGLEPERFERVLNQLEREVLKEGVDDWLGAASE